MIRNLVALLIWTVVARLMRIVVMVAILGGGLGFYLTDIRSLSELRRTVDDAREAYRTVAHALER